MRKENKILFKYFLLVFVISALIVNWNHVSWFFNYKAVSGAVSSVLEETVAGANAIVEKNIGNKETKPALKSFEPSDKENSIEIPKLGISAPLVVQENATKADFLKLLNQGVVYFPSSVLPGEPGQTIILGHSAPTGWPKIRYDWVFSKISELTQGDEIFVYFNHKKYIYHVTGQVFLERGEELSHPLTNSENMLILISCWPPGKDLRRIAVEAI